MRRRKASDPLATAIEQALDLGRFVSYRQSWDFVSELERVKGELDALVEQGEAERALSLYELFLAGCYEKAEEIDDSGGNLGGFFETLFTSWVDARQKAGHSAHETVRQILSWMDNDEYGFCWNIEGDVARTLNKEGLALFRSHFRDRFETAFASFKDEEPRRAYDYPAEVLRPLGVLKAICIAKKDVGSYIALCERISPSPKDCEQVATLCKAKRRFADALEWVERGLSHEQERRWGNESGCFLTSMRTELLDKVGRKEEALRSAWNQFAEQPSEYSYSDLMKYAPKEARRRWHDKAMETAKQTSLSAFIEICAKTKEWDALARHVDCIEREELENISHYVTEKAAKGLEKRHALAAAKVYAALGMRIVRSGKSKYYGHALDHLRNAKKLAQKANGHDMWLSLAEEVRKDHSRKHSFIGDFEAIVAGTPGAVPDTFEKRAKKRWKKQASK